MNSLRASTEQQREQQNHSMMLLLLLLLLLLLCCFCHTGSPNSPVVEQFFARCWKDSDFLKMFTEPSCHLAWLGHLKSSTILAIDYVSQIGNGHDGSFRVIFSDGSKGLFKGCESEKFHFSWKAEIFAYHIDRELALQRTPASIVRTLLWNDIFALQPTADARNRLMAIKEKCSDKDSNTITGMMQGWTKFDVKLLESVDKVFQEQSFRARFPTSQQLEYIRLLISMFVDGNPEELFDRVEELQEPPDAVAQYRTNNGRDPHRLLIGVDNGEAQWSAASEPVARLTGREAPCQRLAGDEAFTCKLHAEPEDSNRKLMSRVVSLLATACQFPRQVATTIINRGRPFARRLGEDVIERVKQAGLVWPQFNATVLDNRVLLLNDVINDCLRLFGSPEVIFEEYSVAFK